MSNLPWKGTLRALQRYSSPPQDVSADAASLGLKRRLETPQMGTAGRRHSTVTIIEKLSPTTLSITWRDPTACNYSEQIWLQGRARHVCRCALSGASIHQGDLIYRPRMRRGADPVNSAAMILASAITQM
jgi:hypothetical protein